MQAERALGQSEGGMIVAAAPRGLVTILREGAAGAAAAESFLVRFVPRGAGGRPGGSGAVAVGSYDDLDIAVTIAAVKYGVCDGGWMPAGSSSLPSHAPGARHL